MPDVKDIILKINEGDVQILSRQISYDKVATKVNIMFVFNLFTTYLTQIFLFLEAYKGKI